MHPDDRQFLLDQFASIRVEMATKSDIEELATYVQRGFTDVTIRLTHLDERLIRVEDSTDLLVRSNFQGQVDHLRDDMRLVKTKLGMV